MGLEFITRKRHVPNVGLNLLETKNESSTMGAKEPTREEREILSRRSQILANALVTYVGFNGHQS
jgi:hypothetical protein